MPCQRTEKELLFHPSISLRSCEPSFNCLCFKFFLLAGRHALWYLPSAAKRSLLTLPIANRSSVSPFASAAAYMVSRPSQLATFNNFLSFVLLYFLQNKHLLQSVMDVCERATRVGFGLSLDVVSTEIPPTIDWDPSDDSRFSLFDTVNIGFTGVACIATGMPKYIFEFEILHLLS